MNATIPRPAPFMELLLAPRFGLAQGAPRFFAAPERPMRFIAVEDLDKLQSLCSRIRQRHPSLPFHC
jgi:hypothetical protein